VAWLLFIAMVVILDGFHVRSFQLPSSVIITLIGSTTGAVIGIFLIIVRHLFPNR
jgi:hypothetical protein